jgi:hypothetical protein
MSLPNFIVEATYASVKTHQSAYSDGNFIWSTNAGSVSQKSGLYRYAMDGVTLLASNTAAVTGIPGVESDVYQLNGMELINGKIYAGLMNYPNGSDWPAGDHQSGHLYAKSWIARYDATTLAFEDKWEVGDRTVTGATSAAKWTEGCGLHIETDHLFVCFHGDPVLEEYSFDSSGDLVFVARHTLPSVDNASSTWNAEGFEDVTFDGDYCYLNRHAATLDDNFYQFKWNGTGFDFVQKFARLGADYTQGMNIQPGTNLTWWCQRTTLGGQDEGSISKVRVVGFDLGGSSGVNQSFASTGVKYTHNNGTIISK